MGASTLLPRAKFLTALSLSMALSMAWPSGVPFVIVSARGPMVETRSPSPGSPGPSIGERGPVGSVDSDRWQAQADDLEEPDDREFSRFPLFAILPDRRDLPSLVPSSVEPTPDVPSPVHSPFPRSRPLRC